MRTRRAALAVLATVLVLAAAGLTAAWLILGREPDRISADELREEPDRISAGELRKYPPILVVWADNDRAEHTAAGDLYVVHPDGARTRRIFAWKPYYESRRDGVYGAYDARWSPDRKLLAVTLGAWYGDPYGQVALASPDGRTLQKLTGPSGDFRRNVTWSPDGRVLVYSSYGELWTVSPRRGKRTRIFSSAHYLLSGTDWAPDGRHVAAGTPNGIVTVSRDGADVVKLTRGTDEDPVWSPDGRAIAFVRARGRWRDLYDVYVVGADGQGLRRLVSNAWAPLWSRDSRSVLFTEAKGIGVIGSDGRHRRTLTPGNALAWSPDASKILFEREAKNRSELWVMDADGERQTRLPFGRPGWAVITADWGR
jgi:Tol biopolymer transport system component